MALCPFFSPSPPTPRPPAGFQTSVSLSKAKCNNLVSRETPKDYIEVCFSGNLTVILTEMFHFLHV